MITVVKSAGVPPSGALLSLSKAVFSSGVFSPSLIAALSFSMIGCGVCAGANSPVQLVETKSANPLSTMVGTSGSCGMRFGVVTASARSAPAWIRGNSTLEFSKVICTLPARRSVIDGPPPL